MKYLIIFVAFIAHSAMAAWPQWYAGPAQPKPVPDASACYAIADPDSRTMCRAEVKRDPSMCYAITNPDTRALCRARAAR